MTDISISDIWLREVNDLNTDVLTEENINDAIQLKDFFDRQLPNRDNQLVQQSLQKITKYLRLVDRMRRWASNVEVLYSIETNNSQKLDQAKALISEMEQIINEHPSLIITETIKDTFLELQSFVKSTDEENEAFQKSQAAEAAATVAALSVASQAVQEESMARQQEQQKRAQEQAETLKLAQEYEQKASESQSLGEKILALEKQIEVLTKANQELEDFGTSIQKKEQQCQTEKDDLKLQVAKLESEAQSCQAILTDTKNELDQTQKDMVVLENIKTEIESEKNKLDQMLTESEAQKEEVRQELLSAQSDLQEKMKELQALQSQIQEILQQKAALEEAKQQCDQKLNQCEAENAELQEIVRTLQSQNETIKKELEETKANLVQSENARTECQRQYEIQSSALNECNSDKNTLQNQVQQYAERLQVAEQEKQRLQVFVSKIQGELQSLMSNINSYKR